MLQILNQIIGLLNDRKDLIEKYFILEDFKYSSYLNLIKEYNTTEIEKQEEHKDETCLKMQVINFITTSRKTKGTQTLGDRLFGYYLKSKGLTSLTLSLFISFACLVHLNNKNSELKYKIERTSKI